MLRRTCGDIRGRSDSCWTLLSRAPADPDRNALKIIWDKGEGPGGEWLREQRGAQGPDVLSSFVLQQVFNVFWGWRICIFGCLNFCFLRT